MDLLVDEVLDRRSVQLAAPADNVEEPEALQRVDGSSVYTVAWRRPLHLQRILDAEARLVAAAGRHGGVSVDPTAVDLALLEMAANRTALDAGQAFLVARCAPPGHRLQLAIAPAGAGKTTAMRALTMAWTRRRSGNRLARRLPRPPSSQSRPASAPTPLATHLVPGPRRPADWAAVVGPSTLVIIDEAGMADTLSLNTAVQFAIGRGGSVRLVGDDQQLRGDRRRRCARDITHIHGALHLAELHRFTDPAEAAASLALREATLRLEFYLDHGRIHIGDVAATTRMHSRLVSTWARRDHDRPHPEPRRRTERLCPQAHRLNHTRLPRPKWSWPTETGPVSEM